MTNTQRMHRATTDDSTPTAYDASGGWTAEDPSVGEMQLEDRSALRRVAGLSTELEDITEVEYRQLRLERVVLVGVWTGGTAAQAEASLAELAALAETAAPRSSKVWSSVATGPMPPPTSAPARPTNCERSSCPPAPTP